MMTAYDINSSILAGWVTQAVLIAPIIVGIVQAVKITNLPERYAPLVAILTGIAISFMTGQGMYWGESALSGVIYGLSASGLYSGVKAAVERKDEGNGF